jgi:hypothetical protein
MDAMVNTEHGRFLPMLHYGPRLSLADSWDYNFWFHHEFGGLTGNVREFQRIAGLNVLPFLQNGCPSVDTVKRSIKIVQTGLGSRAEAGLAD